MSSPLPILRNTTGTFNAQVLYPFSRSVKFRTTINQFMNAGEQRWPNTPPLYDFTLPMNALTATDKAAWLAFFDNAAQTGRFGTVGTITIGSTTYSNLTLMSDDLSVSNPSSLLFNQQVSLRQVNGYPWTPTYAAWSSATGYTIGQSVTHNGTAYVAIANGTNHQPDTSGSYWSQSPFPTFSWGGVAEQPFTQISSFLTSVGDNPNGPRFTYPWYQASLSGFPTGYLRSWTIEYPLLGQADMDMLEGFFTAVQGMANSFSFTDPLTGSLLTHVRFAHDNLDIRYLTVNQLSTSISLVQTQGS